MSKKDVQIFLTAFLVSTFLVFPFLDWLGMPSFANVLVYLFGEPDDANIIAVSLFAFLFLFLIIFLIVRFPFREFKKTP